MRDQRNRFKSTRAHLRSNMIAYLALVVALSAVTPVIAAATIGTSDIKNKAVTRPKIDNKAVNGKKIDKIAKRRFVGGPGAPDFSNGGQGDCNWVHGSLVIPTLEKVHFYRDHLGFVHMGGTAIGTDGPGGDADCASSESEDMIAFRLPKAFRPAKSELHGLGSIVIIVVGKKKLVAGPTTLPAGAVFASGSSSPTAVLDGITFRTDKAGGGATASRSSGSDAEVRRALNGLLNL